MLYILLICVLALSKMLPTIQNKRRSTESIKVTASLIYLRVVL